MQNTQMQVRLAPGIGIYIQPEPAVMAQQLSVQSELDAPLIGADRIAPPPRHPEDATAPHPPLTPLCAAENALVYVPVFLAQFLQAVLVGLMVPFFPVYASNELGMTSSMVGVVFAAFPITMLVCSPLMKYAAIAIGRHNTLYLGLAALAAASICLAHSNTELLFVGARVVQGAGAAAISVSGTAMLISQFPRRVGMMVGPLPCPRRAHPHPCPPCARGREASPAQLSDCPPLQA